MKRLALILALATTSTISTAQRAHIQVSPNVLVSHEPGAWLAEFWIAAHPTDPGKLLGMGTIGRWLDEKVRTVLFSSSDGGQSWSPVLIPQLTRLASGDPITGYGRSGTAYASALLYDRKNNMMIYRSSDNLNVSDSIEAGHGDHQRLAVDYGTGRYGGRVYIASEIGGSSPTGARVSQVGVWRSDDDGLSWTGPVIAGQQERGGLAVYALNVLTDGTVMVHLLKYPEPGRDTIIPDWTHLIATSPDGAETFAAPHEIAKQRFGGYGAWGRSKHRVIPGDGFGLDAAADARSSKFPNRVYRVYNELTGAPAGKRELRFSLSDDHGATWSAPKTLAADATGWDWNPAVAVNADGVVGIMWLSSRGFPNHDRWNAYFTASTDGGATFLPPVKLSNESSIPFTMANARPTGAFPGRSDSTVSLMLWAGFTGFIEGGHYLSMAAGADGVFHPLWTDARGGTYQMMTARVAVVQGAGQTRVAHDQQLVSAAVALETDPIRIDSAANVVVIPLRLRNVSKDTILGPITVTLKGLGQKDAQVMNATRGGRGPGATFDYTPALRDLPGLPPGAVTDAVLWRVHVATLRNPDVNIEVRVTGGRSGTPK